jgi:signal transduction histidine kinase
VTPALSTRIGEALRGWIPALRRGFVEVLVARDPPLRSRTRRSSVMAALATWAGGALLGIALIGLLRTSDRGATFVTPGGAGFGASEPKTFEVVAVLAVLLLCVRHALLAWRIGYALLLFVPFALDERAIRAPLSIAVLVCYWVAGLRHGRAASWTMSLLMLLPAWVLMRGQERPALATLALFVIQVALDATIVSRRTGHALSEQIAQVELEESKRAVLEERTRIAREMHDIVAHHMSLIAVQAETAPYRLDDLSDRAKEEFAAMSAISRQALNDVRRLLGVLRSDRPAERDPQPQLGDVPTLVEAARRAGASVELSMPANGTALASHAVGLCAYRIVQEALSNAGRHAPGAPVHVVVERDVGGLRLDVVNGPSVLAADAQAKNARPGHGIAGMRERVAILGGSISAGPNAVGGFAVSAVLPLDGAAA